MRTLEKKVPFKEKALFLSIWQATGSPCGSAELQEEGREQILATRMDAMNYSGLQ